MARTPSTMIDIGTVAPNFELLEPLTGKNITLSDFSNQPLLVVFSCNHCPYVLHILENFVDYSTKFTNQGLNIVMINSNDVDHFEADSPDKMIELGKQYNFKFPYLYDATQQVAKAYQAACTPDFFLFDGKHQLVYRGQYDSSRPHNKTPVTGHDLHQATHALLNGEKITANQLASLGCNIKWKAGNEPNYFNAS